MALAELTRRLVQQKLSAFCEERVPLDARDQVRLSFAFRGSSVTLFEERAPPPWCGEAEWGKMPMAQLRFAAGTGQWSVHWADRNGRWHPHPDIEPTANLDDLLLAIDNDNSGAIWG